MIGFGMKKKSLYNLGNDPECNRCIFINSAKKRQKGGPEGVEKVENL